MANYVSNRVICAKEDFKSYFLDRDPFGDGKCFNHPYITFRQLFGCNSYFEYDSQYVASIYNGYGFSWKEMADGMIEIKFCTRWQYPIEVILKALELCKNRLEWYACEENHIYVSKFVWKNGKVKELVLPLDDEYWNWDKEIETISGKQIEESDCDDSVWYFIPFSKQQWREWPSKDGFLRYNNVEVVHIEKPDWDKLKAFLPSD